MSWAPSPTETDSRGRLSLQIGRSITPHPSTALTPSPTGEGINTSPTFYLFTIHSSLFTITYYLFPPLHTKEKSDTVSLFFVIFAILVSHLYSSLAERDRGGGKKCEGGSSAYLRTAETPLTIRNHIKKSAQFVRFSTIFD